QTRNPLQGSVAVFWDIENCCIPFDVPPEDVANNIRMAIWAIAGGAVTLFSAYGDFNSFSRKLREGCHRTGVKLVDVPNGRKDAADKAILIDMFLFALDNRPPSSSIVLISGDVDFAPALHVLSQRGYSVVLVIPSGIGVSPALCNSSSFVLDWQTVARGEGIMPPRISLIPKVRSHRLDEEEDPTVFNGTLSKTRAVSDSKSAAMTKAQRKVLSKQLVKLLEVSNGGLHLCVLESEYHKAFGQPLSAFTGAMEELKTFLKQRPAFEVKGNIVYLRQATSISESKGEDKQNGNEVEEEGVVINGVPCAAAVGQVTPGKMEVSVEDEKNGVLSWKPAAKGNLTVFKHELEEILVSYCSCRIFVGCFEAIYEVRYKKRLDYKRYGVGNLRQLLSKLRGVVELREDPFTGRKFI
ncbi:hypothetical protein M569_13304, partial [Genlisea aurea]